MLVSTKRIFIKKTLFEIYTLLTKNLSLFSLNRKLNDQNKHEMIYMLWKECMPSDFYRYIFTEENFLYLNGKNMLHPKWLKLFGNLLRSIKKTIRSYEITFVKLRTYFSMSIQMCPLRCIDQLNGEVLIREVHFTFFLKLTRTKKKLEQSGKNRQNYTIERNESFAFVQKLIEIDMFDDEEEKEIKDRVGKRKKK